MGNAVDSIKDEAVIRKVKQEAREMGLEQYLFVLIGLNTGFLASDILALKVRNIRREEKIRIREIDTGQYVGVELNPAVRAEINRLLPDEWEDDRYIFQSPQTHKGIRPIKTKAAYNWVREACRRAGFTGPVGCNTLRKTFGYMHYQKYRRLDYLMMHFGHKNELSVLRYIGYGQYEIDKSMKSFRL